MANKKKQKPYMSGEEIIEEISKRRSFAKKDVREILDELKMVFEECIEGGVDIDIKGLIHVSVKEMTYKKAPGIVGFHGGKDFKSKTRRVVYQVPKNFKEIIRKEDDVIKEEGQ